MIDKLVYTYWTDNGLNYNCNFPSQEVFARIFKESIVEARKYFKKVVCYTDLHGEDKLKELGIEIETEVVLYESFNFDKRFWNYPKLITYSLQYEPFVHCDIDLILKDFDLFESEIVTEKQRGASYLSTSYSFLGDLAKEYSPLLTCSGFIGGNNLEVFQELFKISKDLVKKENWINKRISFDKLVAIEEIILTILINRKKLKIDSLKDYIHYQGPNKINLK